MLISLSLLRLPPMCWHIWHRATRQSHRVNCSINYKWNLTSLILVDIVYRNYHCIFFLHFNGWPPKAPRMYWFLMLETTALKWPSWPPCHKVMTPMSASFFYSSDCANSSAFTNNWLEKKSSFLQTANQRTIKEILSPCSLLVSDFENAPPTVYSKRKMNIY